MLHAPESDIAYDAGTDLEIELTAPLEFKAAAGPGPAAKLVPLTNEDALYNFVNRQPFQTWAEKPAKPSDITNLMLAGTREQIEQAFKDAGWVSAAALSTDTKFETFRAMAEQRGYKRGAGLGAAAGAAPARPGLRKADQHVRATPSSPGVEAARIVRRKAGVGGRRHARYRIEFSEQNRTFIHKIDSAIDRERAKVVNDLLFTGRVQSVALVERPGVPKSTQNATGDSVATDARMAVLLLN